MKNNQKQRCCRLIRQPCMQRHWYPTTHRNKHGGCEKQKTNKDWNKGLCLLAQISSITLSSSRLNERMLWFVVHYVLEARCFQLLLRVKFSSSSTLSDLTKTKLQVWGKALSLTALSRTRRQQLLRVIIRRPSVSLVHWCRQVSLENIRLNRVWITMAIKGFISLSCGQLLVRVKPIHDVQWQVKSLFWLRSVWALQFICPAEWLKSHSGLSSAAWDSLRADG